MSNDLPGKECKWIGPEQDPYIRLLSFCGKECVPYRSYCNEHIFKIYQEGTAQHRRRATYNQANIEYWEDLFESVVVELESEGLGE
jgi:hypothetical protein